MESTNRPNKWRISATAGYLARPFIGRRARLVDVSVVLGLEDLFELQLDPQEPYDPESLWLERHEFEPAGSDESYVAAYLMRMPL